MQLTGTLRSWNEDKGFGFIAPTQGGRELFVHISAFPRDGTRPAVGEALQYELGRGQDGRPQAVRVMRKAIGTPPTQLAPKAPNKVRPQARSAPRTSGRAGQFVALLLVVSLGAYAFHRFHSQPQGQPSPTRLEAMQPSAGVSTRQGAVATPAESTAAYQCDGRKRCTQMTSCQEARWFNQHCPGMEMDGDGDGEPCEDQWCKSSF